MSLSFMSFSHDVRGRTTHPDADPRIAQAMVVPNEHNQQAFAMVREASLHADTRIANQVSPHAAPTPAPGANDEGAAQAHLPPPEVARMIPCKFFPYCRYGDRCIFQHPSGPILLPPGAPPVFFAGPGMPFLPGPAPYGIPPPFAEMNRPMFPVQYGPNGMQFYPVPAQALEQAHDTSSPAAEADAEAEAAAPDVRVSSEDVPSETVKTVSAPRTRLSKKGGPKANRSDAQGQRGRASNGHRPLCAFFARSACRYANDCRFPHVLPDGTDARQLPADDKGAHGAAPRSNTHTQDRVLSDNETPSSGSLTPQNKKPATRRANQVHTQRAKNMRRGSLTSATTHRKAPQQRVPNSDEFPALPGGGVAEPAKLAAKGKAHFSAILSAPAPPKPAGRPVTSKRMPPSEAASAPMQGHAPEFPNVSSPTHIPSSDFASVVAAPSAVTA